MEVLNPKTIKVATPLTSGLYFCTRCYCSRQYVRTCVRVSVMKCTILYRKQTIGPWKCQFLPAYTCWQDTPARPIFYLNRQRHWPSFSRSEIGIEELWEIHTWLIINKQIKRWQMWQILLLRTHRKSHVTFRLAYLHFTVAHYKSQGQGHAHFECDNLANGDR